MRRKQIVILILLALVATSLLAAGRHVLVPASAAAIQDGKYSVPGTAGRKWVDTGLDLKPGVMVYLFAEGEVDHGSNIGTLGPAGGAASGVSNLPAETTYRYGLVARVTSSRTNPEDDLREDHAYGERKEFCSRTAGRLWLTVNDKEPNDNRGEFIVIVKLGVCDANPLPAATPDPGRGVFRVKIIGFRVENVVHNGLLDAGDDAYLAWDAAEFNSDGRMLRFRLAGQSAVYGDTGRRRTQVRAGTQGPNGGLKNGDEVMAPFAPTSADRIPMLVGDFELVDGRNAVLFAPTVWIAKDDPGNFFGLYRQRFQLRSHLASYDVRELLERNTNELRLTWGRARNVADWFEQIVFPLFAARHTDRPLGLITTIGPNFGRGFGFEGELGYFAPDTFLLMYKTVTNFLQTSGVRMNRSQAQLSINCRNSGPPGSYHILIGIERLQ